MINTERNQRSVSLVGLVNRDPIDLAIDVLGLVVMGALLVGSLWQKAPQKKVGRLAYLSGRALFWVFFGSGFLMLAFKLFGACPC